MSPRRVESSDHYESAAKPAPEQAAGLEGYVPPRPLPKKDPMEGDVFLAHNEKMRELAKPFYRELQQGPVPIRADNTDLVMWMRSRGVRIKAHMRADGSFYELEPQPDGVAPIPQ